MEIYNKQQKKVGELRDGIYYTPRKKEHFMIIFQGFGISEDILKILKRMGCIGVCIIYNGEKREKYVCDLKEFINSKKSFNFEGNDLQKFVSVKDMNKGIKEGVFLR